MLTLIFIRIDKMKISKIIKQDLGGEKNNNL